LGWLASIANFRDRFRFQKLPRRINLPDAKPVTIQKRLSRIFGYHEALNQLRNSAVSIIDDQRWGVWFRELPDHPSVQIGRTPRRAVEQVVNDAGNVLRIRRPTLTPPPEPPTILVEWLERGWEKYPGEIKVHEFRNIAVAGKALNRDSRCDWLAQ
jgi:hypothetical protein